MSDKIDQAICNRFKEAIYDEQSAPSMYRDLRNILKKSGLLTIGIEYALGTIINEEEKHEKTLLVLSKQIGCNLSTKGKEEERYYKKPLAERIALAKMIVAGMGR